MPPSLTHLTQRKMSQQDLAQFKITQLEGKRNIGKLRQERSASHKYVRGQGPKVANPAFTPFTGVVTKA